MRSTYAYPWQKWMDGREHTLRQGRDFSVTPKNFTGVAYMWARRNGMRIRAAVDGTTVTMRRTGGGSALPVIRAIGDAEFMLGEARERVFIAQDLPLEDSLAVAVAVRKLENVLRALRTDLQEQLKPHKGYSEDRDIPRFGADDLDP